MAAVSLPPLPELLEHGSHGLGPGPPERLVGEHDLPGIEDSLHVFVLRLDVVLLQVVETCYEIREVLPTTGELPHQTADDVMGLTERYVVTADQVVRELGCGREVSVAE